MIKLRRVYAAPAPDEGLRVLVDRLWPRGVRKADLALDLWAKDLAPSPKLRTWFGHDAERFTEFARRYRRELAAALTDAHPVVTAARRGDVTLLYAARDPRINHAVVLRGALKRRLVRKAKPG